MIPLLNALPCLRLAVMARVGDKCYKCKKAGHWAPDCPTQAGGTSRSGGGYTRKFYAVKRGRTPGVYRTWAEAKTEKDAVSAGVSKMFDDLEEAQEFVGGEQLCRAWELFRAGNLEGAAEIFAVIDPEDHGGRRIGEVRKERVRQAAQQESDAKDQAAAHLRAAAATAQVLVTKAEAAQLAEDAANMARVESQVAVEAEQARLAEERLAAAKRLKERSRTANAAALVEEQEAAETEAATARMVADARAKRKKAAEDRVAGEEEERLATVDLPEQREGRPRDGRGLRRRRLHDALPRRRGLREGRRPTAPTAATCRPSSAAR